MSRNATRVLAAIAFACGAAVLVTAGGDPAHAVPDRWSAFAFASLAPALAAIGFFPGWYALGRVRSLGAWTRTSLAVLVSLLAAAAAGGIALRLGVPLAVAARALAAVTCAFALVSLVRAGRDEAPDAPGGGVAGRAPALVVVAFVVLVAALYAASPELRARGDGWFHAAVAAHVAQLGVPPDDPWYAGLPLHYAWAMHVAIDVLVAAAPKSATPLGMLAGWSVLAALAVATSVVAAGARWAQAAGEPSRAGAAGAWALALAAFAVHPLGFWIWIPEAMIGRVRGWGEFVRPLSQGAGETLQALGSHLPHPSLAFFPDKLLIPTAFGLAYATAVTALDALFLAPWRATTRALVAAVAILAALVFHPLVGASLLAPLALAAGLELARGRRVSAFAIAGAGTAAVLVASPYLATVLRGRTGSAGPWLTFAPDMLLAIAVTGVAIVAFAWHELSRAGGVFAAGRARVGLVAMLWLLAAVTLGFVQRNETKLVSLGLLALAIPAGAFAARRARFPAIALAVAAPGVLFAVVGFARDAGQQAPGKRVPAPAYASGYAWIAAHTSPRDVFLEAQTPERRDPVRDLLVHGPRALVWGGDSYASNWGYPASDLAARRRASSELAAGALSEASVRWLAERFASSGGSVYAVEREDGHGAPPRALAKPGAWTRVYAGDAFALDRLDASSAMASAPRRAEER